MSHPSLLAALALVCLGLAAPLSAAVYEVGDGQALATPSEAPWESLAAGDTVLIHWRAEPYRHKWVICRAGTEGKPITVRGVPGPAGQLPLIDGSGAKTRRTLAYWGESRGVIKIGGASAPPDLVPQFIVIENLEIQNGRPPARFRAASGAVELYGEHAAAIYVEKADHLIIRNCILHDSGHGLFIASSDGHATSDVLIEGCYLYGNGMPKSGLQHNAYTAASGIIFQYNRFGPPRADSVANNLKDRSCGLIVRYNWIEGGNRNLDLVDGQDSKLIRNDPRYRDTFVYGNILLKPAGSPGQQIVHYGGDTGTEADYRKGTLHFYNNTIVSARPDKTTLFNLATGEERCDCRNNLFYVTGNGRSLALLDSAGVLDFSHNWLKPDWRRSFGLVTGQINDDGSNVTGTAPGFLDEARGDFRLSVQSPCVGKAGPVGGQPITEEYQPHRGGVARKDGGKSIGAMGVGE